MFHLIAETHDSTMDVEEPQGEGTTTSPGHGRESRRRALVSSVGTKRTEGYMLNKA